MSKDYATEEQAKSLGLTSEEFADIEASYDSTDKTKMPREGVIGLRVLLVAALREAKENEEQELAESKSLTQKTAQAMADNFKKLGPEKRGDKR